MLRPIFVLAGATALWAAGADTLLAAEPTSSLWPPSDFSRGPGYYLDPWKFLALWFVFLCWVRSTDWISQDAQQFNFRWSMWNAIAFFTFFVGILLFFLLPNFFVGLVLLLLTYLGPLIAYIVYHNKQVRASSDKVFTPKHIQRVIARKLKVVGINIAGADEDPRDAGPKVQYKAQGAANDSENSINQITARQHASYMPSRELIHDSLGQRASHVMLDYTANAVNVRYQVDGVWHDRSALDRLAGDGILEVFKTLAALKVADRRSRQAGQIGLQVDGVKYSLRLTSQGTQTGERVLLQFEPVKPPKLELGDLGMRDKMRDQVLDMMSSPGLFVFCSLPGGGLTTTIDQVLTNSDRYIRNFVEVVDGDKPFRDIENVHPTKYSPSAGETPMTVLPKLIRSYPDVVIVRDVTDVETLQLLCEQVEEDRLTITSVRAKEAVEALLRLMMLKIPPAEFAPAVKGVLNVRLVRKLCEKCKEAYPPPPEVLKQLGLPAGRIEALYRTPTQPINPKKPDEVCDQCSGIGYYGRTGIFELLIVEDNLRKVLTTAPKLENLRLMARKLKHRSLQEEGILLVAKGVTSIQELLRVLKQ